MSLNELLFVTLGTTLVLLINWRALASHRLPPRRLLFMAAIWVGIILVMTAIARLIVG